MIEFLYPWALTTIFLPLLVYWFSPTYKERKDAVQVPFFQKLLTTTGKEASKGAVKLKRNKVQQVLLLLGWCSLVLAVAKPEWIDEPIEQKKSAKEIMVALDLSGSMSEEDFIDLHGNKINRLDAAKQVLNTFAKQRKHDRLGLILFGDAAYLQAPFTEDTQTWVSLLNETALGIAGWQTAVGDAIGLSIATFENSDIQNRVLILLTDGYDTGSKMPPIKAAEIAKKFNIKIHTIAMGDPQSKSKYRLDTETLEQVANITGGVSFQANNREELAQVYQEINRMEKQLYDTLSFRPRTSLHYLPFALYIMLNILLIIPSLLYKFKRLQKTAKNNQKLTKDAR